MIVLRRLYFKLTNLSWLVLTILTVSLILLSALVLPLLEPKTFTSNVDSLWFTMTTMLTVGYGDLYPTTLIGRIYTIVFLYIVGIALFATFIGKAMDSFSSYLKQKESGDLMYEGKNHVVIIDWSHKAEIAIKEVLKKDKKTEIVVIDNLEKAVELNERVHYVRGNATDSEILKKANIHNSKAILIFADDRISDKVLTDGKSLMIACAVERTAPNVRTIVEIELEEHIENFSHIKIDRFLLADGTIAKLAVDSIDDITNKGEKL